MRERKSLPGKNGGGSGELSFSSREREKQHMESSCWVKVEVVATNKVLIEGVLVEVRRR